MLIDRHGSAFADGCEYRAFRYLGCHRERGGFVFRVFAPCAESAFVTGEFCNWTDAYPMTRLKDGGVWEGFVESDVISRGDLYKYKFVTKSGEEIYKADPFSPYSGTCPETASRVYPLGEYSWRDSAYMNARREKYSDNGARRLPISIYELHIPSWKRRPDGSLPSYVQLADDLCPYLLQMGYTHVEIMEAYERCHSKKSSFYALSSAFGDPDSFKEFVDILHRAGIGVILDWNISDFSDEEHSLSLFDGKCLFEREEGEFRLDHSKRVVQSFLISNAVYLCERFHVDGIRMESLEATLLNERGVPDRASVSLVRRINATVREYFPDVMMLCDDLPGSLAVTSDTAEGLGFTFKWDSVCTKDTLSYASVPLLERASHTSELSAPLRHAFGEASVLTFAHNDGKSFMSFLSGSYDELFAQNRLFFSYMMTRPGKKLRFMGSEIGQFDEWNREGEVQWFLLDYVKHAQLQLYLARLGALYLEKPYLWELDCNPRGFTLDSAQGGILSFRRFDSAGNEAKIILNFTPYRICKYSAGVSHSGVWREILSSDSTLFGGTGVENGTVEALPKRSGALSHSLAVDLPPLGAVILEYIK